MAAELFDFPANPAPSGATLRGRVVQATLARLGEIVDTAVAAIRQQLPAYGAAEPYASERSDSGAVAASLLHSMAGQRVNAQSMSYLSEIGVRRGIDGFPLHEMLRALDLIAGIVWDCTLAELQRGDGGPAEKGEASMQMSIALLGSTSQIAGVVSGAFVASERELKSSGEQVRRDIFEDLLEGSSLGLQALRDRSARAGYQLGDAHGVLVAAVEGAMTPLLDESVRRLAGVLRGNSFGAGTPLVRARGASVVAIIPIAPNTHDSVLHASTQAALLELTVPPGLSIVGALGRVESAMPGIPTSYRQARRALDAARATGVHSGVVSYSEMLPSLLLLQDPRLALDTFRATVEPLHVHDAKHGSELVATLDAFLFERGALAATAKRLYVHRHTLGPRLERIEEVCGFSLRDRADLLMLELGLQARVLLQDSAATSPVIGRTVAPGPAVGEHRLSPGADRLSS